MVMFEGHSFQRVTPPPSPPTPGGQDSDESLVAFRVPMMSARFTVVPDWGSA